MIKGSCGEKVCTVLALFLFLFLYPTPDILTGLETTEEFYLIIVSDLGPVAYEVEKACDLKDHLVQNGFEPACIIYLAPYGTDGSDGEPTIEMMEEVFGILSTHEELFDLVTVYISDHFPPLTTNGTHFRFLDGNVTLSTFNNWLGGIHCDMLQIYVGGNHSGASSDVLRSEGRELICSMGADRTATEDEFSLVRGCSSPDADLDDDGFVSFHESYLSE
ncbi:MAG: hypothetical protein JXA22_04890, partial [Candidatus Thermoplasmatota archaeon]|nr:hypothetical protein [Candidatus Thermoplasmatota archaeon]